MHLVLIGIGGFAGAVLRYLADGWISDLTRGAFPWGTLVVNVTGALLIGIAYAAIVERNLLRADLRGPLMIGFLGAYTTFSTLAIESWRLAEDGAWLATGLNLVGSVLLGMAAVIAGLAVGRAI